MTSDKPLALGLIGLGGITMLRHLPALLKLPQYKIAAVADIDESRARRVANDHQIADWLSDAYALIQMPKVEAVAICTPPAAHAALIRAALDAHKYVFVEKPLTLDVADATLLAEMPRACSHLVVGFNLRHHDQVLRARELLHAGRIGKIRAIHTVFTNVPQPTDRVEWRRKRDEGGDNLSELGSHHFDICRFLCDAEFTEIRARQSAGRDGSSVVTVQACMDNDILMTSVLGEDLVAHNNIEVLGDAGRMVISCYRFDGVHLYPRGTVDGGIRLRIQHAGETLRTVPRAFAVQRYGGMYVSSYRNEWLHFYRVARAQAAPCANVKDGAAAAHAVRDAWDDLT